MTRVLPPELGAPGPADDPADKGVTTADAAATRIL